MSGETERTPACQVLVVQSDRTALEQLVTHLRQLGIDAHGVGSFEGGREQLARRRWDVLVTDVRLGAYNGLQLAVRVRATQHDTLVILTGAGADPALEAEAAALQAHYLADATTDMVAILVVMACGRTAPADTDTETFGGTVEAGI